MKHQCQALDGRGGRCKAEAVKVVEYFGDESVPAQTHLSWACVQLCADHSKGLSEFIDEAKRNFKPRMNQNMKGSTT